MGPTPMDPAAKRAVLTALREQLQRQLAATEAMLEAQRSATGIDDDSPTTVDDLAQADVAGDLIAAFEGTRDRQRADLEVIDGFVDTSAEVVGAGSIIAFGGNWFVVGVPANSFEVDGCTYEGLSTDAPIYAALRGKRAGDSFEFHGRAQRVDVVT